MQLPIKWVVKSHAPEEQETRSVEFQAGLREDKRLTRLGKKAKTKRILEQTDFVPHLFYLTAQCRHASGYQTRIVI